MTEPGQQHRSINVPAAIQAVSAPVFDLGLCHVRLMLDARYPWLVLVPQQAGAVEVEDLSPADRARLMEESVLAGRAVRTVGAATGFDVEKLNIGALGNVTPDLHVHVVGRRRGDAAWPGPVWGVGAATAYDPVSLNAAIEAARRCLAST